MAIVDRERGIVQGVSGNARNPILLYTGPGSAANIIFTLNNNTGIDVMRIDPFLASIRLSPDNNQAARVGETQVSLEILSGLFFSGETTEVAVSAVLDNGRRFVITDPDELTLQSSDESILAVQGNSVVAVGVGTAQVTVTWRVCDTILGTSSINVTVDFSENRPVFEERLQAVIVVEGSPLGTSITTVFADDLDFSNDTAPSRRDTEYRFKDLTPTLSGLFALDKTTGVISLRGPLDRESRDTYIFQIEATDRAQRQAEQRRGSAPSAGGGGSDENNNPGGQEGSGGSGSGSGSGRGSLTPDVTTSAPPTPTMASTTTPPPLIPVDILTVSNRHHPLSGIAII